LEAHISILTVFLDLAVCPVSFDAVVFMTKAKIEQQRVGADKLHVALVGNMRDKSQFYSAEEAQFRLWQIVIPACSLFGATMTLAADWEQAKRVAGNGYVWPPDWDRQTLKARHHLVGDIITLSRAGAKVPRLQATAHARKKVREGCARLGRPLVTLTLRNTYILERNANRADWEHLRKHVESRGYAVAMIEDTDVSLSRGHGFAELNLDIRMAMYQEAALNVLCSNGPASLCWFGERDYMMLGAGIPAEEWDNLFVKQGLPLGESWPWAGPRQRLVYKPATYDVMKEEFERWVAEVGSGEHRHRG
jgi:hypothetical protein